MRLQLFLSLRDDVIVMSSGLSLLGLRDFIEEILRHQWMTWHFKDIVGITH